MDLAHVNHGGEYRHDVGLNAGFFDYIYNLMPVSGPHSLRIVWPKVRW